MEINSTQKIPGAGGIWTTSPHLAKISEAHATPSELAGPGIRSRYKSKFGSGLIRSVMLTKYVPCVKMKKIIQMILAGGNDNIRIQNKS